MGVKEDKWAALEGRIHDCGACARLRRWSEGAAQNSPRYAGEPYWARPVAGFGDRAARLLVLGLAPGRHGANRTGRPFTGDAAGEWLYRALFAEGFSNRAESRDLRDGLRLKDVYITNVVRCAPPGDRPAADEIARCRPYLREELSLLTSLEGVLVLGRTAFVHYLGVVGGPRPPFAHGGVYRPGAGGRGPWMVASYHPSQRNTRTGRLTEGMWAEVWAVVRDLLGR